MYKGRLVLNLSIFRNPNALAHSVILILPMIYFLGIWRRFLLIQELAVPLFIMPLWCLYWTESKGAFLSGGAGMVTTLTVGRPKWFQAAAVGLAYVIGVSALMALPRMHELESIRNDQGVKGRLLAWEFAWTCFENLPNGVGYRQFTKHVPVYTEGKIRLHKPTHSSYVEVAAELGKRGLFLWLGILYYCLRCLALAKTRTDQEERLRRLLFTIVIIYMASSWMTNISYRGTFFVQTGAIAALLRLLRRPGEESEGAEEENDGVVAMPEPEPETAAGVGPVPLMLPAGALPVAAGDTRTETPADARAQDEQTALGTGLWRTVQRWLSWRLVLCFLVDMGLVYLLYRAVVWAWLYFMLDWTGF